MSVLIEAAFDVSGEMLKLAAPQGVNRRLVIAE